MTTRILQVMLLIIMLPFIALGCESTKRGCKSIGSDLGGGLNRKVTLYANDGSVIRTWEGKFDISPTGTALYFDLDGKRITVSGTMVIEEQ